LGGNRSCNFLIDKTIITWNLLFSLLNYGKNISRVKDGLNFMDFLDYRVFIFSNKDYQDYVFSKPENE